MQTSSELSIDVVSDVVCPWCLVGIERLDQALARTGVTATVRFHPFLLDPTTPPEGEDLRERLRRKYGVPPEQMFARVEQEARSSGIELDFEKVRRGVNTVRAHTLIGAAASKGVQPEVKKALLRAYFLEGRDVSEVDVLADIGARHGFSPDEVRTLLADPKALEATRAAAEQMRQSGVTGVPFMVFNERFAVSGAQPVEAFVKALTVARSAPTAA